MLDPHQHPPDSVEHVHAHDHCYRRNALAHPLCRRFPFPHLHFYIHFQPASAFAIPPIPFAISPIPFPVPYRHLHSFLHPTPKPKPKGKRGGPLTKYQIWYIQASQARLLRGRQFGPGAVLGHADGGGEGGLEGKEEEGEIEGG